MDIVILRRNEKIEAIMLKDVVTIDRNVLKQLPIFMSISYLPEEGEIEVFGHIAGIMIDRQMSEYQYALVKYKGNLGLIKINSAVYTRSFIDQLMEGEQIFVV